jgi:hypothetical protein
MIFFDAAGLSNPNHEPVIVVAGVIIHADKQWRPLGDYLTAMADEFVPKEHRPGFAFHATELFSGGKIFTREKFPREERWKILDELMSVPQKFDLPIVWGRVPRAALAPGGPFVAKFKVPPVVHGQMIAFTVAAAAAEHWMNSVAEPDEVAQMVMENDNESRRFIGAVQRLLSDPQHYKYLEGEQEIFKLTRVMFPMHFEEKTDSSALQIADACAFALKRWAMKAPEAARFYEPIQKNLVNVLKPEPAPEAARSS